MTTDRPAKRKSTKRNGPVYPKESMFLRVYVGKATANDGTEYEMAQSQSGCPMVKSSKTGKTWSPGWEWLIEQAIKAGVDK